MGAGQSNSRGNAEGQDPNSVIDYYQLLEVDENATADEIKVRASISRSLTRSLLNATQQRSFRRLALIHHPDKNHADVEGSTKRFAALQQAYEVCLLQPFSESPCLTNRCVRS